VAAFCMKCGAGLTPGVQFCTACGAAVGASAPAQPPVYGRLDGVPVQPAPAGNSAVKVILIVVGVIIGLGLVSMMAFTFAVSRFFHVNQRGNSVTLSTSGGTISTGTGANVSAADLGVPIYPGATRREGGMQINSANGSMVTVVFSTPDPISNVVDFYKGKLGGNVSVMTSDTGAVISAGDQNKQGVIITIGKDNSSNGTAIAIMRTKSK